MATHVYVVPMKQLPLLSEPGNFWPVLHDEAQLAATLPQGSGAAVEVLFDYLASEARIRVPPGHSADLGATNVPPVGTKVACCLSQHDAKDLRSRMLKRGLLDLPDPTEIFDVYDRRFSEVPELCAATVSLFERLADYVNDDDQRLLVVIVEGDRDA